jgi:hypothetical protein
MPGLLPHRVKCLYDLILEGSDSGILTTGSVAQPRIRSITKTTEKLFAREALWLFMGVLLLFY